MAKKCHSHGLYRLCFCFKYNQKPYLLCEIILIPTFSKLFWIALFIENNFSFILMLFLYWMVPLYKLWNRTVDCVMHMVFIHYIHRFNQSWSLNFNPNWKLNQPCIGQILCRELAGARPHFPSTACNGVVSLWNTEFQHIFWCT